MMSVGRLRARADHKHGRIKLKSTSHTRHQDRIVPLDGEIWVSSSVCHRLVCLACIPWLSVLPLDVTSFGPMCFTCDPRMTM